MISINNINNSKPYKIFYKLYSEALEKKQSNIEAIAISSFNQSCEEVESRFVNLKYINNNEWIFFSNYNSPKASQFYSHEQISALFYWSATDTQIRIKAKISKTAQDFSDEHYLMRSIKKNALAHSSNQSFQIKSYENVLENYKKALADETLLLNRPDYWGGFSFKPYYFEFWQGNKNRLNKRETYELVRDQWQCYLLQP